MPKKEKRRGKRRDREKRKGAETWGQTNRQLTRLILILGYLRAYIYTFVLLNMVMF